MPRRSSLAPLPSRPDADLRGVWRAGEIEAAAALLIASECGLLRGHLIDVHPSQSITVVLGLGWRRRRRWPRLGQAGEAKNRVELDSVRSNTGLPVLVVEEGDANYAGSGADPPRPAGSDHLLSPGKGCASRAEGRGRLGDHRARAASQDEVWSRSASVRSSVTAAITL
jgi:hypothetical protein